jgi:hypothetical protein
MNNNVTPRFTQENSFPSQFFDPQSRLEPRSLVYLDSVPKKPKKPYTPSDKASYLLASGRKLANQFRASAFERDDAFAIALSDCLRETYQPENIYTSTDLINYQTGELFDGYGVLQTGASSRLSLAYQQAASRRARRRIEAKIAAYKLKVNERYRFITLTMPYIKADVDTVLRIQLRSLELFKKRKLWKDNVAGAFFGDEMTIGAGTTPLFTHYHTHTHCLAAGKYIPQWQIANTWTDCVETACNEFGVEFLLRNLDSNRLVVDIRDVRNYCRKRSITLSDAVQELCKYFTKGSDYEKVPTRELVEIEYALRNRQMVKSYGVFNQRTGTEKRENSSKDPLLDTQHTFDGEQFKAKFKRNERKIKSLVKLGESLILDGKRDSWLKILRLTMQSRREFRKLYLAAKFPLATFKTLDGNRWQGVSVCRKN